MAIRMSGLSSGLDTEAIVSALVSSYSEKKNKYKKAQTKVSWKQDAWKSVNSEVYSLYQKASGLRFTSAYATKKATVSDTTKATVSASSNAANVSQSLEITELASAGYITGGKIKKKDSSDSSKVTGSTKLSELMDISGDGTIAVTTGGKTTNISVNKDTTISSFVNSLKDAGLQANFDSSSGRIFVNAKKSGTENDFSLTGADSNGLSALSKLGLSTGASNAEIGEYLKYAGISSLVTDNGDGTYSVKSGTDSDLESKIKSAITDTINAYSVKTENANAKAKNTTALSYLNAKKAYTEVHNSKDTTSLDKYLAAKDKASESAYYDPDTGKTYVSREEIKDSDGKVTGYKYKDSDGKETESTNDYKKLSDLINEEAFKQGLLTKENDAYKDNGLASYTGNRSTVNSYEAKAKAYDDAVALRKSYDADKVSKLDKLLDVSAPDTSFYDSATGAVYTSRTKNEAADGTITYTYTKADGTTTESSDDFGTVASAVNDLATEMGLLTKKTDGATTSYEDSGLAKYKQAKSDFANYSYESEIVSAANSDLDGEITNITSAITDETNKISAADKTISDNAVAANGVTASSTTSDIDKLTKDMLTKVNAALSYLQSYSSDGSDVTVSNTDGVYGISGTSSYSSDGAKKVNGTDAKITLNGVEYTSSSNAITVNGLTINALAKTDSDKPITVTTQTDAQGLYDKIKDFLSEYNDVINDLTKLYNADSSKGYEPLTDEEKDKMSDTEVEKWEKKIKDSLLRRDTTLNTVMSTITNSMAKSYSYTDSNGVKKSFSLASFGISTLGILGAEKNEYNAYHIDGDADDSSVSSKTDKLMAAITEDPDSVVNFFKDLTEGLYKNLDKQMKSTSLRSAYTIYNDKELKKEYDNYSDLISTWEERLADMENSYYKKFSKMESALATLQSNSTSLTNMMG